MPSLIAQFDQGKLTKQDRVSPFTKQPPRLYAAYPRCRWCHGSGCIQCETEMGKDYKVQFPDGPKPIAVIDTTTPEGVEKARQLISMEAITGFYKEGQQRSHSEIIDNPLLDHAIQQSGVPMDEAVNMMARAKLTEKISRKAIELGVSGDS